MGAFMNVRINASGYSDKTYIDTVISNGKTIESKAIELEAEILNIVNEKIGI
jgi:glutamate formiminotransferase/formiminotetrahydrofolate cyclodeaminase